MCFGGFAAHQAHHRHPGVGGVYPSWKYVPFLVLSVIFSCFVTFLGTFYMVAKKNAMALVTTCVGAGLNLVLNYFLIPKYGVNGAAFATFACYFTVFVLRAVDTRRIVRLDLGLGRMAPQHPGGGRTGPLPPL